MVYVGVDVAKSGHVAGAVDELGGEARRPLEFANSAEGFERCAAWIEGAAGGPEGALVGMEATGSYWMAICAFLAGRGYAVAVINPVQACAVRRLRGLAGVKSDRVDAALIAEALRIGRFDETRLAGDEVQSLRTLTRYRQSLKEELAGVKAQCGCLPDTYFPEYEGAFSDTFGAGSRAVLSRSPLPFELARRRQASLARDISEASRRDGAGRAADARARAAASVGARLGEGAASFQIKSLVRQMDFLDSECARADKMVRELLERVEPLVLAIPGVSHATGAQIVAEVGDASRFRDAAAPVSYAGPNPSVSQSGRFERAGGPITKHGSPHLRRALWLAAERARRFDPSLREFYERKRAEGKPHRVAVTAVARKLCHVVFAVMRDRVPYDPEGGGRGYQGPPAALRTGAPRGRPGP